MKGDWDFRIFNLVKPLMELIFNPCGEFRWSTEDPVSQIHSPYLHVGAPAIFSDLLRTVQMLKKEWVAESNGKRNLGFLSLRRKSASGQNCSHAAWVCSERPSFGQNTLMKSTGWKGNKCHPFNSRRERLKAPKIIYTIWGSKLDSFLRKNGVSCSVLFTLYCLYR